MIPLSPDRDRLADWRGWAPPAAEAVLWLLLAVQAVRLGWLLFAPVEAPPPATAAATNADSSARLSAIDLFYRSAQGKGSGAAATEALGYRLYGLRSGPDGSSAILGKDGKQRSYAEGERIEGGVRLDEVRADHVWLAAADGRHRLELLRLAAPRTGARTAGSLPTGAASTAGRPSRAAAATTAMPTATTARNSASTTDDGPTPVANGGAGVSAGQLLDAGVAGAGGGLAARIPGGRTALLGMAGLRADDVVLSVDGLPVDAASLATLGRQLAGRSQMTVQYRRDGRIHTTTLNTPR